MRPNSIFKLALTVSVLCVGTSVGGSSTDRGCSGASDSLLVQLDWGPASLVPIYQYETVPSFSLFADGLVIYHRISREDNENAVLCLQLSSEEAEAIRRHVLTLGVQRLQAHESNADTSLGSICVVSDARYSIIRVRLDSGVLRSVKNVFDFANQPQILRDIRGYLTNWHSPKATPYHPEKASLFVNEELSTQSGDPPWPLDQALLRVGKAYVIDGVQYDRLLNGRRSGAQVFSNGESAYSIIVRPWLPGEDFTQEVEDYRRYGRGNFPILEEPSSPQKVEPNH